ncbi:hypothetical protein PIB30_096096 [Stylosanthes scabra]|uniref:Uncharacterized protein n=1 Tax=Stylosanthes scabra TaxID=79078 RepID=A0ABU6YTJ4_9FABA|nr:hypothetical protein [Stylosanthes scabra]
MGEELCSPSMRNIGRQRIIKQHVGRPKRAELLQLVGLYTLAVPLLEQTPLRGWESELGCPPTQSEIFERTHTRKEDRNKWVDRRSQETDILFKENLQKAEEERSVLISQGITDLPPVSEEEVWFKTVGGCKRGRIYGVGRFELVEEERTKYAELEARYQAEREEWRQTHQRLQQEIKWLDSSMSEMKSSMGQK